MGAFQDLGKALRWLRTRQDRKQYEIAEAAGITKAMLSAYETGKQNPSIETLEKILAALGVDLMELHNALQVNATGDEGRDDAVWSSYQRQRQRARPFGGVETRSNVYHVLGIDHPLPAEHEFALSQMLGGFHQLVRHIYHELERNTAPPPQGGEGGEDRRSGPHRLEEHGPEPGPEGES
jgi:DNA-binding XRE family transcriptional regulator